ncbi:hypothetical protein Syun_004856 [Stephania yunnanensis]|uniref:Protein kinase domain-containing protein n=1 Tax=Stephania yunnanensis TaxID=152371 RepID=A0AAP0L755_9MAGN
MASQTHQQETTMPSYPLDPTSYKILQKIGNGVSATVYKAACLPMTSSIVAIKAIDLERSRANLDDVRREAKAMTLLSHPNILRAHCSFTVDHYLWVVMPFMSAGSLRSIISSSFPDGLNEASIAVVLKEILNALLYLHDQGHLHRDIKAGNILVDSDGSVKLADFGVSASIYEPNSSNSSSYLSSSTNFMLNEVTGTPYWMAPEVIHSHIGYSFKADIWSFGITALELAHGRPPLSHLPPWKSLFMRITNRLRPCDYEKGKKDKSKKFSKNFRDMVASCLATDPLRRPNAARLLKHPFFKNCKNVDFLVKNMLNGLPPVEERYYRECLNFLDHGTGNVQGDDEESVEAGPVEKHRRISGWNFNEEAFQLVPVFPTERLEDSNVAKEAGLCIDKGEQRRITRNENSSAESSFRFWEGEAHQDRTRVVDEPITGATQEGDRNLDETQHRTTVDEPTNETTQEEITEVGVDVIRSGEEKGRIEEHIASIRSTVGEAIRGAVAAQMMPYLMTLLESLDDQRLAVANLIFDIKGEELVISHQQQLQHAVSRLTLQVSRLALQLEKEKTKSAQLERELELLKRKYAQQNSDDPCEDVNETRGATTDSNTTNEQ